MDLTIPGIRLTINERFIHICSEQKLSVLSSAVVGGDLGAARHVLNMRVTRDYCCERPDADLRALAAELGIGEPFVGLLTAARVEQAQCAIEREGDLAAAVVLTAGLSQPVAAGLTPPARLTPGTINMIILVDGRLSPAARANALMTATEAKTLLLCEAGIRTAEGHQAGGTATDALVLASTDRGPELPYGGPVTVVGWLIGRAVRRALGAALTGG
jgi:iron complex transport system ATP-binding protein